jgi:hypothetical protein
MALLDRARGELAYRNALKHPELEPDTEACAASRTASAAPIAGDHPEWTRALTAREGEAIVGGGMKLKTIKGMGTVYDWRDASWSRPNGGRINPLVFVQHIPVVPNVQGIGDFVTLRNVLVAQGLMVQAATDREGNVALFTRFDELCFQARGANQFSCGAEHMHMTIGEAWSRKQLRAAAWLVQLAKRKHGIPTALGRLGAGDGLARVLKRGQTTHMAVSHYAGFNDRSDPDGHINGSHDGYDFDYVRHCVVFFDQHGHFSGA